MDNRNITIYDVYCAAFLMSWGCQLLGTIRDESNYVLFVFDKAQAENGLREWKNPQTTVVASSLISNLKYLRSLVRGEAA